MEPFTEFDSDSDSDNDVKMDLTEEVLDEYIVEIQEKNKDLEFQIGVLEEKIETGLGITLPHKKTSIVEEKKKYLEKKLIKETNF